MLISKYYFLRASWRQKVFKFGQSEILMIVVITRIEGADLNRPFPFVLMFSPLSTLIILKVSNHNSKFSTIMCVSFILAMKERYHVKPLSLIRQKRSTTSRILPLAWSFGKEPVPSLPALLLDQIPA